MNIYVECFGPIREAVGQHEILMEIADGASIATLLDQISASFPRFVLHRSKISILSGLDYVDESHRLSSGETISLAVE